MPDSSQHGSMAQERLEKAVTDVLHADPFHFESKVWAVRTQAEWAEIAGVSRQTVNACFKAPPFDCLAKSKDGKRINYVRIGEPDPLQPSRQALDMRDSWVKQIGRKLTSKEYGNLHGLIDDYRRGWALPIFRHAIHPDNWGAFMQLTRPYTTETTGKASGPFFKVKPGKQPMFFKFPHIGTLRLFWLISEGRYVEDMIDQAGKNGLPDKPFWLDWWADYEARLADWEPNWRVSEA